jgi:hypothetical protein
LVTGSATVLELSAQTISPDGLTNE